MFGVTGVSAMWHRAFVVVATSALLGSLIVVPAAPAAAAKAPAKPTATIEPGNGSVVLRWSASASNGSSVRGYQVAVRRYWTNSKTWSAWRYTSVGSASRALRASYPNGAKVEAMVRARNGVGYSSWSARMNTLAGLPGAVPGTKAISSDGVAIVSWSPTVSNGSPINGNRIYFRSWVGGTWSPWTYRSGTGSARSSAVGELVNGRTYQFYVRVVNSWGAGPPGPTVSVKPRDTTPPGPVTNLAVTAATPSSIELSWTNPTDADLAEVVVRQATGPEAPLGITSGLAVTLLDSKASSVTVPALDAATEYSFSVFTRDANGNVRTPAMTVAATTSDPPDVTHPGPSGATAMSVGRWHSCALVTSGALKCWGWNADGQLGSSATGDASVPVDVVGLSGAVSDVSAGGFHTCALMTSRTVECWGNNYFGQTGNGSMLVSTSQPPESVVGLSSGVTAVSAGFRHTCALMTTGTVKCWGSNEDGQLGDGTTDDSAIALDVVGLPSSVIAITTGLMHSCALLQSGGVKCWGSNEGGQLGNGTWGGIGPPVDVVGLQGGVTGIAAGELHTCATLEAGGVQCWGSGENGELGNGSLTVSNVPVGVLNLPGDVSWIGAGVGRSCAVVSGSVKCWGSDVRPYWGVEAPGSLVPLDVDGLSSGVAAVGVGYGHFCALSTSGAIQCWGYHSDGQLGDGGTEEGWGPANVFGLQ